MTEHNVTISRELLRQVIGVIERSQAFVEASADRKLRSGWGGQLDEAEIAITALRNVLEQPAVEPEMHDAKCQALTGGSCECSENPAFIDKPWARFCGAIGRGPDAPYPGMIEAFEQHYSQSFADRDWRNEASVWAAAWKAAKAHAAPQAQPAMPAVEPYGHVTVRRLSQRFENHTDQYTFYPAGQIPYTDNVDECIAVYAKTQAQQPIGWLRAVDEEMVSTHLGVADITDSYEDAKRKLNTLICWHVDVSHDPKVNGSAQQPRKAVKLSDEEIGAMFKNLYGYFIVPTGDDTQFARAIEQAVWAKNGVTE